MMIIENKYSIGDSVYLKTDKDQHERLVTQICINPTGMQYNLTCGQAGSWHYEFEITEDKSVMASTTN